MFMCFVWISEQTAIISLWSINWLGFRPPLQKCKNNLCGEPVLPLSVIDPVHQLNIMWYFHEILRRFICGEMWSKRAFRENPFSDVTVAVARFLSRAKLLTDGMLLVCRSELYVMYCLAVRMSSYLWALFVCIWLCLPVYCIVCIDRRLLPYKG
jgi:hypothetical protein